jgi:uncharacterized protein YegP (UPF0339 family)
MATIEIVKDKKGQFRFRIKANNGETIATGESYKQKPKVMLTLKALKSAVSGKVVDLTIAKPAAKVAAKPGGKKKAAVAKSIKKAATQAKPTMKKPVAKAAPSKSAPTKATSTPAAAKPKASAKPKPKPAASRESIAASETEAANAPVAESDNTQPQTENEVLDLPEFDEADDTNETT